jgi:hypothetical protein
LQVKKNDPEFIKWASERRRLKKESIRERMAGQNLLVGPGNFKIVADEKDFFAKMIEQYVISALACNRLITADTGMRNIMRVFEAGQFTRCKTVFLDRSVALEDQIPSALS